MPQQSLAADLLKLAAQLRAAAVDAGRPDVAAKADEAIVLIAGDPVGDGHRPDRDEKANTVVKILDGLGF